MNLKQGYSLAKCCRPQPGDSISGYFSHNQVMIVHRHDCGNLQKVEAARIVSLTWEEILDRKDYCPDADYDELETLDWRILEHHQVMGVDYSHVVARSLGAARTDIFEHHQKLRDLKLLERVKPLMMQYRKGIVKGKWIKHRNHTYYDLTQKARDYLKYRKEKGK